MTDLEDIARFIRIDSASSARRVVAEIREKITRLKQFPLSGRVVPEYAEAGHREVIVGNYRIIYRVIEEMRRVEILAAVHGARDLGDMDDLER